MIFITLYLLHSEYESSSRPKTASKSIHMIMHENPNNAESEIIQIASSADEKKIAVQIRLILRIQMQLYNRQKTLIKVR